MMRRGVLASLASTDHKVLAVRGILQAAFWFAAGGLLALGMRTELARPGLQVVSLEGYSKLFTMHGSTMVFLVVVPLGLWICVYFVPLQIGAASIAGPRAALSAAWLHLLGGIIMWSGWLTREGPGRAGWYSYDPLSDATNTPGEGMDLWIVGVILATLGSLVLAACLLATVVRRRAPGMTFLRMPPFTWTAVVTGLLACAAFPSLIFAMTALLIDRHGGAVLGGGGFPIAYQHLFWFYGHPAVYVMFFPYVGMVAESVAVFSSRRFFGYRAFVLALLAFTVLSMSAWGHHMFTTGAVPLMLFSATSTALIIPAGVDYIDTIGTMWKGSIRLTTSLLFSVGFLVQFLIGGLSGIFLAAPGLDMDAADTYVVVAHFHYTLFAGSLFGLFAGVYLWWPKVTGRFLSERLGKAHFVLLFAGTSLTFLPQFLLGGRGMARRLADYPAGEGWTGLNALSTLGSYVIALAVLVFLAAVVRSLLGPRTAGDDPWGGHALEWATSSPPPRQNFDRALPPIRSYAPLLDRREGTDEEGEPSGAEGGEPARGPHEAQPQLAGGPA